MKRKLKKKLKRKVAEEIVEPEVVEPEPEPIPKPVVEAKPLIPINTDLPPAMQVQLDKLFMGRKEYKLTETGYNSVSTYPSFMGCGLYLLSGLSNIVKFCTPESWKEVAKEIRKNSSNTLMAVTGDSYPEVINTIETYGFKLVARHINTVHGRDYVQYIYLYIIDDTLKPKDGWHVCPKEEVK